MERVTEAGQAVHDAHADTRTREPSSPRSLRSTNTASHAARLSLSPWTIESTIFLPVSSTPRTTKVGSMSTVVRRTRKLVPST